MRLPPYSTLSIVVLVAVIFGLAGGIFLQQNTEFTFPFLSQTQTFDSEAKRIAAACSNENRGSESKETCYSNEFQTFAASVGPQKAFETLFKVQKIDEDATGCHFIGHGIGYGTYERSPDTWQEDFRSINKACTYGAMHGILEMAVQALPDGLTFDILPTICGENPPGDCNHIVGHLTLLETRGDIPQALELCTALSGERQREFCHTGVFMENITAVNLVEHGYVDRSYLNWPARVPELTRLCEEQTGNAHVACWKEMAHALDAKYSPPADVFETCDTAREADARRSCKTHAIGIMAAGVNFSMQKAQSMCELPQHNDAFQRQCYLQLVASSLSTSKEKAPEVIEYCAELPNEHRTGCLHMAQSILARRHEVSEQRFETLCADVPSSLSGACMEGGNVNFSPHEVHEED